MTTTHANAEAVDLNEVRAHVERDKKVAHDVIDAAREELGRGVAVPVHIDITGAPTEARAFLHFKNEQRKAVEGVRRDLYFAKVETEIRRASGSVEPLTYLVSKHRGVAGGLMDDNWVVVSWTSPITTKILDSDIGQVVEFQAPRRPLQQIEITARAKYGIILPEVEDTTYSLHSGTIYVEHERVLAPDIPAEILLPQAPPEPEYEAAEEFGLTEIIELADIDQREAMHLPFRDTLLVEGPPGSGKTSIGLMRIPCLIDRQWEELDRLPETHPPYHQISSMYVLVLNEEMIDYLSKLIRSVGVHGVPVSTLANFCQRICRDARTLSGRRVRESAQLTRLKSHPLVLPAYWAGFQAAVGEFWSRMGDRARRGLQRVSIDFGTPLADRLDRWVATVRRADDPASVQLSSLSLAQVLDGWRAEVDRLRPDDATARERDAIREQLEQLRRAVRRLVRRFFSRRRIVPRMMSTSAFDDLCRQVFSRGDEAEPLAEWAKQARYRTQSLSEADFVIGAWLATHVSMMPEGSDRALLGAVRPRLTHVMFDEAQDISPCHIAVVQRLLDENGTITLVGDFRQRISARGHFNEWTDLGIETYAKAVFTVNHRQSRPLGEFVQAMHSHFYDEPPAWRPSKRSGPLPRLRRQRGNSGLADAVADEIRHWREQIPNATVGILFHGGRWDGLRSLAQRVESALEDTLTDVHLAVGGGRAHYLSRTDCAIIATVAGTKGLEFDAAVVIDPRRVWRRPLDQISTIRRNGLYVAASRPKQGLSIIIDDRSSMMAGGVDESLYVRVDSSGA